MKVKRMKDRIEDCGENLVRKRTKLLDGERETPAAPRSPLI